MAEAQKAKAKGKKIGQNRRQPSKQRYDRTANKIRKLTSFLRKHPNQTFPGWRITDGYGVVKDDDSRTFDRSYKGQ